MRWFQSRISGWCSKENVAYKAESVKFKGTIMHARTKPNSLSTTRSIHNKHLQSCLHKCWYCFGFLKLRSCVFCTLNNIVLTERLKYYIWWINKVIIKWICFRVGLLFNIHFVQSSTCLHLYFNQMHISYVDIAVRPSRCSIT